MKIRRLKLSGFKSFVEPSELHIHPGLTGVVGPNGCGKSNLLEAIRWAMGEGSARSLRGGAMEDVIFAGTATRPARAFAEVSLLVEAAAGPDAETEIVRRIERGAGSAYRINGRDVRAKDVALLFADAATGAHSPALVSQNRIGAVIAARPAERRQMLEEAAGIAGLHVRRKDAEQKLRTTEANLQRLDELIGEMEGRAQTLRRQAKAAERYRALTGAVRLAEGRTLWARWRDAARAAETAQKQAEGAVEAVHGVAEAQRAAAAHDHAAAARLETARDAAEQAREAARTTARRLEGVRGQREGTLRRLTQLAQSIETLARDRQREAALGDDAATALNRLTAEEAAIAARLAEAEAGNLAAAQALAAAASALGEAETALGAAVSAQAAARAETRVATAAVDAAARRRVEVETRAALAQAGLRQLGAPEPIDAARASALARQAEARGRAAAATDVLAAQEAAQEQAGAARSEAASAASAARAALSALTAEARALAPPPPGICGPRALESIRVDPGYERALAAALGEDLDAPLGPQGWSGADADGDPALPAGLEPLAAHVAGPPELARRLAQIGVAEADDGRPLAAGQRLVTREGRLRRWDGFVSIGGGGAAAERLVRANRLAAIEAERPAAEAALAGAERRLAEAGAALSDAAAGIARERQALSAAAAAERAAGIEADRAALELERLAGRRAEQERAVAIADAELSEAQSALTQAEAARTALPDPAALDAGVAALTAAAAAARAAAADRRAEAGMRALAVQGDRDRLVRVRDEAEDWRKRAAAAGRRIAEMTERAGKAEAERAALAPRPDALAGEIADAAEAATIAAAAAREAGDAVLAAQSEAATAAARARAADEALAAAREARAATAARAEAEVERRAELSRQSGERFSVPAAAIPDALGFAGTDVGAVGGEQALLDRAAADRERIGPVNLVAEQELAELEGDRAGQQAEREELGEAVNRLRGSIGSLNREGRARLLAAFEAVDGHFRRLFTTLFEGGQAHLELVDSDDPLEAGLEIMAQPPGKRLSALTLLSGGEQALTAVALIFALFLTNPAPICVLDEVDAPLDDANIERFCDLLDRMARDTDTRYLVVTHNAVTMARMHRLFGVTMVERGVSRLVSVDLGGAERLLATE